MKLYFRVPLTKVLVERLTAWLETNETDGGNSFVSESNDDAVEGEEEEEEEEEEGVQDDADATTGVNGMGETDEDMEEALLAHDDAQVAWMDGWMVEIVLRPLHCLDF